MDCCLARCMAYYGLLPNLVLLMSTNSCYGLCSDDHEADMK